MNTAKGALGQECSLPKGKVKSSRVKQVVLYNSRVLGARSANGQAQSNLEGQQTVDDNLASQCTVSEVQSAEPTPQQCKAWSRQALYASNRQ